MIPKKYRAYSKKFRLMVYSDTPEYTIHIGNDGIHSVWIQSRDDEGVTLMQSIGLWAKNNKSYHSHTSEIYELDIVQDEDEETLGIIFYLYDRFVVMQVATYYKLCANPKHAVSTRMWKEIGHSNRWSILGNVLQDSKIL